MAKKKFENVYIFLTSFIKSKIRGGNFMLNKKLFQMQDRGMVIEIKLLYYTQSMPTTVLSNVYILINLMNKARYQAIDIIPNNNAKFNF